MFTNIYSKTVCTRSNHFFIDSSEYLYIKIAASLTANLDDFSGLLQNSTQPVNIPGSQLSNSISGRSSFHQRLLSFSRSFWFCCLFNKNINLTHCLYLCLLLWMNVGLLQGTSAPVNIPGSSLNNFSPNNQSNLFNITDPFGPLSGSAPKINNSFGPSDNLFFQQHLISPSLNDALSMSPDLR